MTPSELAAKGLRVKPLVWKHRIGKSVGTNIPRDEWVASCDLLQNAWVTYVEADKAGVENSRAARIAAMIEGER
jgi:hypothetical protein